MGRRWVLGAAALLGMMACGQEETADLVGGGSDDVGSTASGSDGGYAIQPFTEVRRASPT